MVVRSRTLLGAVALTAFSTLWMNGAIAQTTGDTPRSVEVQPINEAFMDAFYGRSGTFFENRRPPRSVTWFLGPFPENDIAADAETVDDVYNIVLEQQNQSDPYLRTPDAINPFDTSLLVIPPYTPDPIPPAQPFFFPPVPQPVAPQARPPAPVPALY